MNSLGSPPNLLTSSISVADHAVVPKRELTMRFFIPLDIANVSTFFVNNNSRLLDDVGNLQSAFGFASASQQGECGVGFEDISDSKLHI